MPGWDYRLNWPKDRPRGKEPLKSRFLGGLSDIIRGKGSDMFIQDSRKRSVPVEPDRWTNWDSYHDNMYQFDELLQTNGLQNTSRGHKRYDPEKRRYVLWEQANDVYGFGIYPWNGELYPRFTASERRHIERRRTRNLESLPPDFRRMGSNWDNTGPKRFHADHREFWQNAHRVAENKRAGFLPKASPLRGQFGLRMDLNTRGDVYRWAL